MSHNDIFSDTFEDPLAWTNNNTLPNHYNTSYINEDLNTHNDASSFDSTAGLGTLFGIGQPNAVWLARDLHAFSNSMSEEGLSAFDYSTFSGVSSFDGRLINQHAWNSAHPFPSHNYTAPAFPMMVPPTTNDPYSMAPMYNHGLQTGFSGVNAIQYNNPPPCMHNHFPQPVPLSQPCSSENTSIHSSQSPASSYQMDRLPIKSIHHFQCKDCPSGFPSQRSLERHIQKHKNHQKHVCWLCSAKKRKLIEVRDLSRHNKDTHDPPRFKCICGFATRRQGNLVRHQKKHK